MDYTIRVDLKNGASRQTNYQHLLDVMGLREEDYLGGRLSEGTLAQVRHVVVVLKGGFQEISRVTVFDKAGKEVFAYGLDDLLSEGEKDRI